MLSCLWLLFYSIFKRLRTGSTQSWHTEQWSRVRLGGKSLKCLRRKLEGGSERHKSSFHLLLPRNKCMRAINAAFIKSRNINYGQRVKREGTGRVAVENLSSARQELLWLERKRSFRAYLCRLEKGKWLKRTLPEVASESSWFITFLWTLINYLRVSRQSFHPELYVRRIIPKCTTQACMETGYLHVNFTTRLNFSTPSNRGLAKVPFSLKNGRHGQWLLRKALI